MAIRKLDQEWILYGETKKAPAGEPITVIGEGSRRDDQEGSGNIEEGDEQHEDGEENGEEEHVLDAHLHQ